FVWDAVNGLRGIPPAVAAVQTDAVGVNAAGTVIGFQYLSGVPGVPFSWNQSTGTVNLSGTGTHPGETVIAHGINDAGYMAWDEALSVAYLRTPAGAFINLGNAPGLPDPNGNKINNKNQIVGGDLYNPGNPTPGHNGFFWDPVTGMTPALPLPGGL